MSFRATFAGLHEFAALDIAPQPVLIDPWLAAGSITLLFGPPSAGKTMVSASLMKGLAEGAMLWGTFPCAKSRVLMVQADMNTALYQERLRPTLGAMPPDIAVLSTDAMPFDVCALKPKDVEAARAFKPDVVFVDCLRKVHTFDENDSAAADRVYAAWRALFPGAAFVFLHHTRKVPQNPSSADVAVREAFRGSVAWAASADTLITMRRVRRANNPNWMTRLYFVRTRSCVEPRPVLLRLTDEMLLEQVIESTLEQRLLVWAGENPYATRAVTIAWLQSLTDKGKPCCSQRTAYRIYDRVLGNG